MMNEPIHWSVILKLPDQEFEFSVRSQLSTMFETKSYISSLTGFDDGTDFTPMPLQCMRHDHTHPWLVKGRRITKIYDVESTRAGITVLAKLSNSTLREKHKFEHYHIWAVEGARLRLFEYFSRIDPVEMDKLTEGTLRPFIEEVMKYKLNSQGVLNEH